MENVLTVINWFKDNAVQIAAVVTSVIGTASLIVKLTPTPKDDTVLAKVIAFVSKFIALNPTK